PEFARLSVLGAEAGVRVVNFIPALAGWFAAVDAVVSMGGYKTLVEAVSTGVPIVCVPRVRPRVEQLIRARAFAERGLVRLLEPDRLEATTLRAAVDAALADGRDPARAALLDHGGADCAAQELLDLATAPRRVVRRAGDVAEHVLTADDRSAEGLQHPRCRQRAPAPPVARLPPLAASGRPRVPADLRRRPRTGRRDRGARELRDQRADPARDPGDHAGRQLAVHARGARLQPRALRRGLPVHEPDP